MDPALAALAGFIDAFHAQKSLADRAIEQVPDDALTRVLSPDTNSIRVIMKHVAGNLRSRFTDFLTADGEKPWRDRDSEFVDTYRGREEALADWDSGWACLFAALEALEPGHLGWTVSIRGEGCTVGAALARSLAHTGYHAGQIVQTARVVCGDRWSTITIPRGGSRAFNAGIGYDAGAGSEPGATA